MKIALLIAGLPRQWRYCIQSQLDMLKNHEVDVYCWFWNTLPPQERMRLTNSIKGLKACAFESPRDFGDWDDNLDITPDNINIPSRMMSQYYAWSKVAELFLNNKGDYDLAIRSRSDLQFVTGIDDILDKVTSEGLVVPWTEKDVFISDLFAVGRVSQILYYLSMYQFIERYAEDTLFNSELLLARHLFDKVGVNLVIDEKLSERFFVRRPYMKNMSPEECLKHPAGMSKWLDPEIISAHEKLRGVGHVTQFREKQIKHIKDRENDSGEN